MSDSDEGPSDVSDELFSIVSASSITVTSPNGGEKWKTGSTYNITWTSTGVSGDVVIDLYSGSSFDLNIGTTSVESGSFAWDIPGNFTIGDDYKILLHKDSIEDDSDANFSIVDFAELGFKGRSEEWLKICETLAEVKNDIKSLADVYCKMGEYYRITAKNEKAIESFEKALPIYVKLNDIVGQGNVYLGKGIVYYHTLENSRAQEMYDKSMFFFEKSGDLLGQAHVYKRKGNSYLYSGDYSKADELYEKALALFKKIDNLRGQGNVFGTKGEIYLRTGKYSKALEMYTKALTFLEKDGDPLGPCSVYYKMGVTYYCQLNFAKALEMLDRSLFFCENAKSDADKGAVYWRKGDIYLQTGNNSSALEMYDKALQLFESEESIIDMGNVFLSKAQLYLYKGDYKMAKKMCDNAMSIFENALDLDGQSHVYLLKGNIYIYTGEIKKAEKMFDKALPFFEKNPTPTAMGNIFQGKGNIYFYTGDFSKALEMYEKALVLDTRIGDLVSEASTLCRKARFFARQGRKKKALSSYEKFIDNIEKTRNQTASSEMKMSFLKEAYEEYQNATVFLLENKYYKRGFVCIESLKARVFLDRMSEGLVPLEKGLKPGLKEKHNLLVGKLSFLSKEIHKTGAKEEKKLQQLKEQYRKTENEFEELLIKIRLENPLYAAVRYPQPVSAQELQKKILKKGEIVLSYFISQEKTYVFLISKKRFKLVSLEINAEKIKSYAIRLLLAMRESRKEDMEMYGKLLYRGLFKPIKSKLKGVRDIIIIPHSHLEKIPFESFIIGEEKSGRPIFFLEKYRIKYIQSASLLSVLRRHYQRNRETNNFIGFGDPLYDYENFKQSKQKQVNTPTTQPIKGEIKQVLRGRYERSGGTWNRLPHSGEEVRAIARLFEKKSQKCTVQLREQATEDNTRTTGMKEFDFIHFACHGLLNDDFQSMVLSQLPPDKSREDGYFTLNEIMNCDYHAKLVVLSACHTGSGKMERAEGVTGLTRAVMYAGTPAVVASLWKVDDKATKELMVKFYKNILEKNLDKVEALRQAKLELIKNKNYSSPLLWSAFVMYGE